MDIKPSTYYHTEPVKALNQDMRDRQALGEPITDLTEAGLLTAARNETGFDRFGDESFLPGFRMLLKALEEEANLNPFGRIAARAILMSSLKNRLWANACFDAYPEILERKIVAPIVILGQARSGTTRLQRMLAADSNFLHLKAWECFNPAPRIGQEDLGKLARRDEIVQQLLRAKSFNPGADAAHPMDPDWPEEEVVFLRHSFASYQPLAMYAVPAYYKWFLKQDKTEAYLYMRKLLKLVSWSRGDPEDRPWILKTPQHMLDLDVLMKVFPDAKVVFAFRDPVKTTASVMSLMWLLTVQGTDLPCRASVRDIWLDCCEQMAHRCIEARKAIPQEQQLDIYYADMNNDWRAVMQRIYRFANIEFTPAAEKAMSDWLTNSEAENRHGSHRYIADDYGTSDKEIDDRMKFYREQYNIPYERK